MKFLVMGVGNKIKKDDAVGLIVSKKISELIRKENVEFKNSLSGRILLLGEIKGYKKVFLIDAIKTKNGKVGDWYSLTPEDLESESGLFATHNISLSMLRKIGNSIGEKMPEVTVFAIEVENPFEFGEGLSKKLENKIPSITSEISNQIKKEIGENS